MQRHHSLYSKIKGKPQLDNERNILLVCVPCHIGLSVTWHGCRLATREGKLRVWQIQCERYPDMEEWHDGLDLLVKENFNV